MLRISLGVFIALIAVAGVAVAIYLTGRGAPYTEIVQTTSGPIRGEELIYEGTGYKAFKGIPYAAPPVGDFRFKDPQPPQKWSSVRDTRAYGKICHQAIKSAEASEDCLTLNVYTPSLGNGSRPVLVWIHGGGFNMGDGTGTFQGPQYLIQEDIVVVSINYRLGPLGFLTTNTADAFGNWGMKDQVAALRWVQENIKNFGGDPKQVTIYGESAGGASVHLQLLSPLSKGLFRSVIAASGTAVHSSLIRPAEQSSEFSIKLARVLGASEAELTDPAKRVQFLRTVDAATMCARAIEVFGEEDNKTKAMAMTLAFVPVIEKSGTPGAFLTEDPKKLILEGRFPKVPLMMGVTDLEGGFIGNRITLDQINKIEENVCVILSEGLQKAVVAKNECPQVAKEIRDAYFGGKPFNSSILDYAYLTSDLFMIREAHIAERLHARLSTTDAPIFNYLFAFDGLWNFNKIQFNITLPGAVHADDLGYVFLPSSRSDKLPPTAPEVITKNRMVRFIGNFVKYGNPTPSVSDFIPVKWEPTSADAAKTMVIGTDLKMDNAFLKTRMDLWFKLYEKYTGSPWFA